LVTKQGNLRKAEDEGAAAIVYKSLFEEQIQLEKLHFDEKITEFDDIHAEMLTLHPHIDYTGVEEHLLNLRIAKESISIPVIASLNAVNIETWIEYAKLISQTSKNITLVIPAIIKNHFDLPDCCLKISKPTFAAALGYLQVLMSLN